ncbi:hypothetical protein MHLNE_03540 [Moorella humiferrea]|uniref:AIPR family protein n=1 Tax=Neomoorella humiferrea TaxID=676965 RepID=UPI0030D17C49
MSENDIIILDQILEDKKKNIDISLTDDELFELFVFEQVLKEFDLSYEELLFGQVDGPDDGGIDGFFVFINDEMLTEDLLLEGIKKQPLIKIYIIQAKQSKSFSEKAIDTLRCTVNDIFALSKELPKTIYNSNLITKVELFRDTVIRLSPRHPKLLVSFIYATKGDTQELHIKVKEKSDNLKNEISRQLSGCTANVVFMGARELLDASRQEKSYTLQLRLLETPISTGESGYVALSTLKDYFNFITDEKGTLRRYLFEANVRDYLGNVEVNRDIRKTLEHKDSLDFWWLNNGVTIISSKGSIVGRTISLDDVQIVNGLQTTQTLYDWFKENEVIDDKRCILVKIIVTDDPEARDRIIKATNFQTAVPSASLRATDRIQRDIEEYFLRKDWFYDRRKNYYKNQGKPLGKIISIPYLAQAMMAIVLREPDNSRARPSTLIKDEADYKRVFNETYPLELYFCSARLMRQIDEFLRSDLPGYTNDEKNNMRFHLAMVVSIKVLKSTNYSPEEVLDLNKKWPDNDFIYNSFRELIGLLKLYNVNGHPIDRIAKSREFVLFLLNNLTF